MKDPASHVVIESALGVTALTTSDVEGIAIENPGGGAGVAFAVFSGTVTTADGSNFVQVQVQHGDVLAAGDITDAATVTNDDIVVNGVVAATPTDLLINDDDAAFSDILIGRVLYRGTKKYCRLFANVTSTVALTIYAVAYKTVSDSGQMPQGSTLI